MSSPSTAAAIRMRRPKIPTMNDSLETLLERMRITEKEILRELQKKELEFFYEVRQGKVRFTEEARAKHKLLVKRFVSYIRDSQFMILLTSPVIWACLIPVALLDLVLTVYQVTCFPVYGIPKVRRGEYVILDRRHLAYLNWMEKLNCEYCSYANGVLAYATEVAARTEQYWCPIKHALRMICPLMSKWREAPILACVRLHLRS